ncbi:MAG: YfhO family protein, partial [Dehalococcoidia bacterium]|nr:YfhO family protein [Dehalococcoidia bacterium]
AMSSDIRNWTLPLWTPNIFGGFPLFADGEAGLFYPPVMILYYFLSPQQAFIWTTVSHFFMAGLFTYAFLRSVELRRFACLVGGIAFMLSGFMVAQLHHVNISNGVVWLPLILCFVERSVRTCGTRRHVNLLLAGGAFGMQALTVHVNIVLMSLPVILGYIAFRFSFGPLAAPDNRVSIKGPTKIKLLRRFTETRVFGKPLVPAVKVVLGRVSLIAWALAIVPLTGLSIGAVKLLPLYELGTYSQRAGGLASSVATSNALTVFRLPTLLFPYFFRDAANVNWGLWASWETRIYVGVLTLCLGLTAVVLVRSRQVFFFTIVAILAFLLGMADTSPVNLHSLLSSLPGYNLIRAPGRYSYLWTFAIAVIAAYGANWLTAPTMGQSSLRFLRERWSPASFFWRLPTMVFFTTLAIAAVALPIAIQRIAEYVATHRLETLGLIQQHYLALPRMLRPSYDALTPGRIYDNLIYSLSLDNPSTAYGLIMVAASAVVIMIGYALRKGKWLWQAAVIVLLAGSLTMVGWQFHPTMPIAQLASSSPVADFLKSQSGRYRVFSRYNSPTTPNLLLLSNIEEAGGYSSIPNSRLAQFTAAMDVADSQLMDIFNVRYLISRNQYVPLPSFKAVAFNPARPILAGKFGNGESRVSLSFASSTVNRVRVVSLLRNATQVPQGAPVGEITLVDSGGKRFTRNLLAGVDTADGDYDRPEVQASIRHSRPAEIAFNWSIPGSPSPLRFYFTEIDLGQAINTRQVEVAATSTMADLGVYGVTLLDSTNDRPIPLTRDNNDRFKIVYRDSGVLVRENTRYLPRAYLVPEVRVIQDRWKILNYMAIEPFDAAKAVVVEDRDTDIENFLKEQQGKTQPVSIGTATMQSYEPRRVRISVNANADAFLVLSDSYYPGWHAYVDGQETKIYQANYLFRAILVPKGSHEVQFFYDPSSFRWGFLITLTVTLLVLVVWLRLRIAVCWQAIHHLWQVR